MPSIVMFGVHDANGRIMVVRKITCTRVRTSNSFQSLNLRSLLTRRQTTEAIVKEFIKGRYRANADGNDETTPAMTHKSTSPVEEQLSQVLLKDLEKQNLPVVQEAAETRTVLVQQ